MLRRETRYSKLIKITRLLYSVVKRSIGFHSMLFLVARRGIAQKTASTIIGNAVSFFLITISLIETLLGLVS